MTLFENLSMDKKKKKKCSKAPMEKINKAPMN